MTIGITKYFKKFQSLCLVAVLCGLTFVVFVLGKVNSSVLVCRTDTRSQWDFSSLRFGFDASIGVLRAKEAPIFEANKVIDLLDQLPIDETYMVPAHEPEFGLILSHQSKTRWVTISWETMNIGTKETGASSPRLQQFDTNSQAAVELRRLLTELTADRN